MTPVHDLKNIFDDERFLIDLEDYISSTHPGFELVGSEKHMLRLASNLSRSTSNNIIYTGPSGVGKSADLYGIAMKLKAATDDPQLATEIGVPLELVGKSFVRLDTDGLFDDNDPRAIQDNVKRVFLELERPGERVLVVEDINDFLRALENNQCRGMLSAMMRRLRQREFQCVWMVREEIGKNKLDEVMDAHSDVRELFTVLEKPEPDEAQVYAILDARKRQLEQHYEGLTIAEEAIREVIKLTYAYPNLRLWTRHHPARGISLLDRISSKFVSRSQTHPPVLVQLEARLAELKAEAGENPPVAIAEELSTIEAQIAEATKEWKSRAQELFAVQSQLRKWSAKYDQYERKLEQSREALRQSMEEEKKESGDKSAVTDYELDQRKTSEIRQLEEDLRAAKANVEKVIEAAHRLKSSINTKFELAKDNVDVIFGELSGIPVADLNEDETDKILNLDSKIRKRVYGQDECVGIISSTIKSAKAGLKSSKRPMGVFICLGSSGVGKSYVAEVTAEELFGDKSSITAFDMSEFMEKHTVSQLKGAPPGYAGYGEGGRLTNAVRRKPYQAILLDEVEKAHPDVFKILLQVFNDGRLSDELGTVRYNNTVFFLTTNLAQMLALNGGCDPHSPEGREAVIAELKKHFPQELLNRVDEFLLFNPLQPEHIRRVIQRDIKELNGKEALVEKGIRVHLSDEDIRRIVEDKYRVEEGARQVQKFIENRMSAGLVEIILQHQKQGGGVIEVKYAPEIKAGFRYEFRTEPVPPDAGAPDAALAGQGRGA